jgi:aromatic ring hydroxylase
MNKPNFSTMTSKELKAYALAHREDDAVFTELTKRVSEKGTRYPYPQTEEDLEQMRQLFQRKVTGDNEV